MPITDPFSDWSTTIASNKPAGLDTPQIDDELRNIKAQVKANITPARYFSTLSELSTLITAIGSDKAAIVTDQAISVSTDTTIPGNITLRVNPGGSFAVATTKTLTINGPIDAGPYQIFSWTGTGAIDISASPTYDCFIEWWGGVAGRTNDCAAAFTKAGASVGPFQHIVFSYGDYRLASAVTFTKTSDTGFGIKGADSVRSKIYIDMGAVDAVTLAGGPFRVRDIAFTGPANCCTNGVVLGTSGHPATNPEFTNVNFFMGATGYALKLQGCIGGTFDNYNIGQYFTDVTLARAANGIGFVHPAPTDYGNNANQLYGTIVHCTGKAIYMENAINNKIRGTIENCGYTIYMDGDANAPGNEMYVQFIDIDNMYMLDGNTVNLYVESAIHITVKNCNMQAGLTEIKNSRYTSLKNIRCETLTINADCLNTVLDNVGVGNSGGTLSNDFKNFAADTVCLSPVYGLYTVGAAHPSNPPDVENILSNTAFDRWTATAPDEWTEAIGGTWLKCGTGVVADTTNHNTPYCAKMDTNGQASVYPAYTLSANELQQVKGKYSTFSIWIKFTGIPTAYGFLSIVLSAPPDWTVATDYNIGDCVIDVAHAATLRFKCIKAGTSHAADEPTWPTVAGKEVTDGTVIWQAITYPASNQKLASTDSGVWRQLSISGFIPLNATTMYVDARLYKAAAADIDYYLSEPCLTASGFAPEKYAPGKTDTLDFIQVGAVRLWAGTPTAGVWIEVGDINLATGQRCTVAGAMGAATWANFP